MKKQISKKELAQHIQEQVTNLYKLHTLKEAKEKFDKELSLLNENKYTKKASEFIGKEISHLQKDKGYKHDRAVAAAINVAKDKGYKIPKPTNEIDKSAMKAAKKDIEAAGHKFEPLGKSRFEKDINKKELEKAMSPEKSKLNEGLTEKGIATVEKWIAELGSRQAAVKMVDSVLNRMIGMTSSDLADTATFANGLDSIEEALNEKDYNGALNIAKDTAKEMIDEEGGGDLFGESNLKENEGFSDFVDQDYQNKLMKVIDRKGYDDATKKIAIKAVEMLLNANASKVMGGARSADRLFRALDNFENKNNFHDAWEIVGEAEYED